MLKKFRKRKSSEKLSFNYEFTTYKLTCTKVKVESGGDPTQPPITLRQCQLPAVCHLKERPVAAVVGAAVVDNVSEGRAVAADVEGRVLYGAKGGEAVAARARDGDAQRADADARVAWVGGIGHQQRDWEGASGDARKIQDQLVIKLIRCGIDAQAAAPAAAGGLLLSPIEDVAAPQVVDPSWGQCGRPLLDPRPLR